MRRIVLKSGARTAEVRPSTPFARSCPARGHSLRHAAALCAKSRGSLLDFWRTLLCELDHCTDVGHCRSPAMYISRNAPIRGCIPNSAWLLIGVSVMKSVFASAARQAVFGVHVLCHAVYCALRMRHKHVEGIGTTIQKQHNDSFEWLASACTAAVIPFCPTGWWNMVA